MLKTYMSLLILYMGVLNPFIDSLKPYMDLQSCLNQNSMNWLFIIYYSTLKRVSDFFACQIFL